VNFLSDNSAAIAPAVLGAIVQANEGFAPAYGDDDWTQSVERRLSEIFERDSCAAEVCFLRSSPGVEDLQ
jgi:threonine aldolase